MLLRIFDLQSTHLLDGLHLFSCACQRCPSWDWYARRILIQYLSWYLYHGWHLTYVGIFKIRCAFNTLEFRKNIEESAPFLRVLLFIFNVWRFLEEAPKLSANFMTVSTQDGSSVPYELLGCLWSCFWAVAFWPFFWRVSGGILIVSYFPVMTGAPKFLDSTDLQLQVMSWVVFSLKYVFSVLLLRRGQWYSSVISDMLYFCNCLSLWYLRMR